MPIERKPDGSYLAWTVMEAPDGQEVSFAGSGATKGEALNAKDAALSTGLKAFPGLRSPAVKDNPHARSTWDYVEPQKPPAPCITIIEHPDGRTSRRDMDWNDRDARRRFLRKVGEIIETGGQARIVSDTVVVEGVQG